MKPLLLLAVLVVALTSASATWPVSPADAAAGPTESAQVLMPFDGAWANDFSTAPWQHSRASTEDWTMDLFAPAADVYARIGNVTGDLRIEIAPPQAYGCVGAGSMVWITVFIDDVSVGRFGYHHLTDVEHPTGATLSGVTEVRVGRTTSSPFTFGGACWHVSTTSGIHTHLVLDNASGHSCYVRYDRGQQLSSTATLAVLGGESASSWGTGPRDECTTEALLAGAPAPEPGPPEGYWMLERSGTVHGFGDAADFGAADPGAGNAVALTSTASGAGYWVLDSSGVVHALGDATHLGDLESLDLQLEDDEAAAAMSATPGSDGYWIFTNRGRAVAFGTAEHHGDVAHLELNGPIIDSVATPTGQGYLQIASDGGIFAGGDAEFHGSIQEIADLMADGTPASEWLSAPIVGLVPTPANDGYWLVASDGGTFSFGAAPFRGSIPMVLPGVEINAPINGMVTYGNGYLMVASDGGVFAFSDRTFLGSLGDRTLESDIAAIAILDPVAD